MNEIKLKLSLEQTDKILKILEDYNLRVCDVEDAPTWAIPPVVSEDYFNEKVNEALED